ncbi:MAG: hypothetical protein Q9M91_06260 [Candidatus Dojkabacteria bacterium]|nr:hypothetical protein [Candidatus Dojkabacteria bacterium]MDQ7021400.1 hypothetical protein [Candidatus Dojkabacteria bacterium]
MELNEDEKEARLSRFVAIRLKTLFMVYKYTDPEIFNISQRDEEEYNTGNIDFTVDEGMHKILMIGYNKDLFDRWQDGDEIDELI